MKNKFLISLKIKYFSIVLSVLFLLLCYSCENKKRKEINKILNEWIGKEILIPDNVTFKSFAKDTIFNSVFEREYKILFYIDTLGCLSCNTKLHLWKNIIEEFDVIAPDKVGFIFVFEFKRLSDAIYLLRDEDFKYPVIIDSDRKFNILNNFPVQRELQCFLLDKENKTLLVGNPTLNTEILNLYKKQILIEFD